MTLELTSITPDTASVGTLPPDLVAIGTGFDRNATAQIEADSAGGPAELTTRFISDTELRIAMWRMSEAGTTMIQIRNGRAGSEKSNALPFTWTT